MESPSDVAFTSKDHHNVLIVSRDSDFGVTYAGKATLKDWLYREFKERVIRKRNVELTQKLTDALKRLNEQVTAGDLVEEERLIKNVNVAWEDFELLADSTNVSDVVR
jgi:cytidylate kinase